MTKRTKPATGPTTGLVFAIVIAAAGAIAATGSSAIAGSHSTKGAIPQKDPLAVRPPLVSNSGALPRNTSQAAGGASAGGPNAGGPNVISARGGDSGPRLGLERPAPERQLPGAPQDPPAGANSGASKTSRANSSRTSGITE